MQLEQSMLFAYEGIRKAWLELDLLQVQHSCNAFIILTSFYYRHEKPAATFVYHPGARRQEVPWPESYLAIAIVSHIAKRWGLV